MIKRIFLFTALTIFSLATCGCVALLAGAAGGAGTAYWLSEKLTQDVNVSYTRVIQAVHNALDSLNLKINKETTSATVTQIISKYNTGEKIWIDIKPTTQAASRISVRVGIKGNKEAERKIMDKIGQYL